LTKSQEDGKNDKGKLEIGVSLMINLDMTQFQNRLASIMPLLFLLLFFLLLLFGAWLSYILMRNQRKKFGENKIFYLDDEFLIIDKLKYESFFQIFVPFVIKFPISSIDYVEIGYERWRRFGYIIYAQIIKKNGRKSFRYWFSVNAYEKRKFFETPVHINEISLIKETMRKMAEELETLHISCKVNEEETVGFFL